MNRPSILGRAIILIGDATTKNGVVVTGADSTSAFGLKVARENDMVWCPCSKCQGSLTPIITSQTSMSIHGRPVARKGDITECGGVLIAEASPTPSKENAAYSQHFQITNEKTGEPLPYTPYTIHFSDGSQTGTTDENGFTHFIFNDTDEEIKIEIKE